MVESREIRDKSALTSDFLLNRALPINDNEKMNVFCYNYEWSEDEEEENDKGDKDGLLAEYRKQQTCPSNKRRSDVNLRV